MPKIVTEFLTPQESEARSQGTDAFTAGWWYHGTTYRTAQAILNGQKEVHSIFWLTRNPSGASQHHGTTVLRCTVNLRKSQPPQPTDDKYNRKSGNEGLDQPYEWLGVIEGRVFISSESLQQSVSDQIHSAEMPSVWSELERIVGNANQAVVGSSLRAAPHR